MKSATLDIALINTIGGATRLGYISNTNIQELLEELRQHGVVVDDSKSSQRVIHSGAGIRKRTSVPLDSKVDGDARIMGYTLRNEELEIGIRDYQKRIAKKRQIHYESGVQCTFYQPEKMEMIANIKKGLEAYYRSRFPLPGNDLFVGGWMM